MESLEHGVATHLHSPSTHVGYWSSDASHLSVTLQSSASSVPESQDSVNSHSIGVVDGICGCKLIGAKVTEDADVAASETDSVELVVGLVAELMVELADETVVEPVVEHVVELVVELVAGLFVEVVARLVVELVVVKVEAEVVASDSVVDVDIDQSKHSPPSQTLPRPDV